MGQLVRALEGRYSARQLLWSKAETEVLKRLVAAQSSSNPKGSGTRMRGGWGSGAEQGQAAVIPSILAGGSTCQLLSSPLPWAWRCVGSKPEAESSCSPSQEAGHGVNSGVGGEGQSQTVG